MILVIYFLKVTNMINGEKNKMKQQKVMKKRLNHSRKKLLLKD